MADPSEKAPLMEPPSYTSAAIEHGDLPLPIHTGPPASSSKQPPRRIPFPLELPILTHLRNKRIILASKSPRRKQILSQLLPQIEIIPSGKPEDLDKESLGPFEYVLQTALMKCLDVYTTCLSENNDIENKDGNNSNNNKKEDPALVIAADTIIVTTTGRILEKPRNEHDHISMLKQLRDQGGHKCYTAVAVLAPRDDARHPGYNSQTTVEETRVWFAEDASDELIESYVRTREGVDKAGGYGLQGLGSLLVDRIEGAADNVVGLPLRATLGLIEKVVLDQVDEDELPDEE